MVAPVEPFASEIVEASLAHIVCSKRLLGQEPDLDQASQRAGQVRRRG
jgi:hypothetical protein